MLYIRAISREPEQRKIGGQQGGWFPAARPGVVSTSTTNSRLSCIHGQIDKGISGTIVRECASFRYSSPKYPDLVPKFVGVKVGWAK